MFWTVSYGTLSDATSQNQGSSVVRNSYSLLFFNGVLCYYGFLGLSLAKPTGRTAKHR
jgi:hypothetical protein